MIYQHCTIDIQISYYAFIISKYDHNRIKWIDRANKQTNKQTNKITFTSYLFYLNVPC